MDLRSYVSIIRRWLWLIALCILIAAAGAYLFSRQQTPIYAAESTTLLSNTSAASPNVAYNDLLAQERLATTYVELLKGREVQEAVISDLGYRPQVLNVSASNQRNTSLLLVTVESEDRAAAAFAANRLPEIVNAQQRARQAERWAGHKASLTSEIEALEDEIARTRHQITELQENAGANNAEITDLSSQLSLQETTYEAYLRDLSEIRLAEAQDGDVLSVIEAAEEPTDPIRPRILINTLLAAILGGLIGLGIGFLIEFLDDTLKTESDVTRLLELGTLAAIERMDTGGERVLINSLGNRSPVIEAYRMLRTNIRFSLVDEPLRSLVVTSPAPSEGKSTTAANLAIVVAQSGQRTILVDADLRRPVQHSIFNLPNTEGLTTALIERDKGVIRYLQNTDVEGLRVLSSGPQPPNPAELLGSQRLRELLEELQEEADIVIVDMPPVLAVADSSLVANTVSGVLLVLRANHTRIESAQKALEQLRSVQARVLGVVLNGVRSGSEGYYYYYYPTESNAAKKANTSLGQKVRARVLNAVPRRG